MLNSIRELDGHISTLLILISSKIRNGR